MEVCNVLALPEVQAKKNLQFPESSYVKRLSPAIKLSFTQALLPITLLTSPLEQFVLLAKSARGAAAVELIKQVLEVLSLFILQG